MNAVPEKEQRIRVGITHGDVNGIGYEIIMKALQDQKLIDSFTIIVYGSSKVASYYKKTLNITEFNFNLIKKADAAHPRRPNIINIIEDEVKIDLGKSTKTGGDLSLMSLEMATQDLLHGHIDVLVTAPINKDNIQSENFHFPGHTEYLASKFKSDEYLMLMVSQRVRMGVVTTHIPLAKVPSALTPELIFSKIMIMNNALKRDFGILKPRIAVLSLNPHAGDKGLLGTEDDTVVKPAIERAYAGDVHAFGPFPADGFFGSGNFSKFDGILAMYHDQGMVPFKLLSFEEGVNYTAGLPFIRTSPAHGTAYDLAGKNEAEPEAFRNAIYLACDIYNNRKMYDELTANPLRPSGQPEPKNE